MRMNKNIFVMISAIIMLAISLVSVQAQTCMVSPGVGHPLLADTDCDRVVDIHDNCPFIFNSNQQDSDGNGLGDLCDLVIESINTNPSDFVYNGRAFNSYVTIYNNRDYNIRNLKVRIFMPELGIESVHYIANIEPCTSETVEFFLRAPACSPAYLRSVKTTVLTATDIQSICQQNTGASRCSKSTETKLDNVVATEKEVYFASPADQLIVVEASFINLYGDEEIIPGITSIRIMPDDKCMSILQSGQVMDDSFIDVMEIQDVYKGGESVFPIRISNREQSDQEYIFSVTGLDGWGTARLNPGSLVIVPKGSQSIVDLYVQANDNVAPGERTFVVSVQQGKEVQRFLLVANVKESGNNNSAMWWFALKVLLIGGIIVLILVALAVGIKRYVANTKSESDVQYY